MAHFHETSTSMKAIDAVILIAAFVFNALVLDVNWQFVAVAVAGAFSGSIVLAYFRRDPRKSEQVFKVLCSAISGIVLGSVAHEYMSVQSFHYDLGIFFTTGLLSLVILRALLGLTEQNSMDVLRTLLQRMFGLQTPAERRSRRRSSGNDLDLP